ncbi:hypothetical protein FGO68_gene5285 [Halteria grandinella]|uniref:Uncharacterized protein n=1 Tax=Halteria grandinella TaxID=5974 RepID=A0A8J8T1X7_HALGN|nr:hypothetical protein FGO68_gene5285 [Halteria grandinella]
MLLGMKQIQLKMRKIIIIQLLQLLGASSHNQFLQGFQQAFLNYSNKLDVLYTEEQGFSTKARVDIGQNDTVLCIPCSILINEKTKANALERSHQSNRQLVDLTLKKLLSQGKINKYDRKVIALGMHLWHLSKNLSLVEELGLGSYFNYLQGIEFDDLAHWNQKELNYLRKHAYPGLNIESNFDKAFHSLKKQWSVDYGDYLKWISLVKSRVFTVSNRAAISPTINLMKMKIPQPCYHLQI